MWNEQLSRLAGTYSTAILSHVDPVSGYPESIRVRVQLDPLRQVAVLESPTAQMLDWRGKACLLFHRFDSRLESLRQLVILGDLAERDGELVVEVRKFVTANGRQDTDQMPHATSPLHLLQFFLLGRHNAKIYLAKRGSPWPPIPYARIARDLEEDQAT